MNAEQVRKTELFQADAAYEKARGNRRSLDPIAVTLPTVTERRRLRNKMREIMFQGQLAEREWQAALEAINKVDQRKEQLAAQHTEACAPIQNRIAEIETQQIERLRKDLPADPRIDSEKQSLREQVELLNVELEKAIDVLDRLLPKLHATRIEAAKRVPTNGSPDENDLIKTGDPKLLAQMAVAKHDYEWATRRESLLRDSHLNTSQAEFAAAQADIERTGHAYYMARQAVIAE
jgi:predicted RNase H-like nuclease (RuvC/YqgF family)